MQLIKINAHNRYLFEPEYIWDGVSDNLLRNQVILIENGLITNICEKHFWDRRHSEEAPGNFEYPERFLLPEITLIPGLIDCHVHFSMNCENLFEAINDWSSYPEKAEAVAVRAASDYLNHGVVAVRDGGDMAGIGLKLKNKVASGRISGPLVTATGRAIYKKGMYGSFLGPGVETVNEAIAQIHSFAREGIDQVKIVLSGLVSFKQFGVVGPLQFKLNELIPIVKEAHSLGLKVMAHASSAEAVETAVLAGIDSVEHGYFIKTRQLELMREYGTAWVPTLSPLGNLVSLRHIPYTGADLNVIEQSLMQHLARLREAAELKVLIGIGTDAGANHVFHGKSIHDELGFFARAGLDNLSILKYATLCSAKINGVDEIMGTLSPGKKPFWLGIRGNPINDLSLLQRPDFLVLPDSLSF